MGMRAWMGSPSAAGVLGYNASEHSRLLIARRYMRLSFSLSLHFRAISKWPIYSLPFVKVAERGSISLVDDVKVRCLLGDRNTVYERT